MFPDCWQPIKPDGYFGDGVPYWRLSDDSLLYVHEGEIYTPESVVLAIKSVEVDALKMLAAVDRARRESERRRHA